MSSPTGASAGATRAAPPPETPMLPGGVPLNSNPRSMVRAYFGDSPWEQLNAAPTFWVIFCSTLLCSVATFILDSHVISSKDQVGVFVMGSYVVFSSYFTINFFLEKYSSSFKTITHEKKFYTISNLIKAGILMSITPFAVIELYQIVVYDRWNTNTLRNLGCIYAIPDFVSMLVVRRMAWTTIFHHVCVQVFNYFSANNNYDDVNVCRLIVVYAAFSTFAYCVNMLLASRFLGVGETSTKILSCAAFIVYASCCAINWTWQVQYLHRLFYEHPHWTIYTYVFLIGFVVWDDVILMKWLLMNMLRKTKKDQQTQKEGGASTASHAVKDSSKAK